MNNIKISVYQLLSDNEENLTITEKDLIDYVDRNYYEKITSVQNILSMQYSLVRHISGTTLIDKSRYNIKNDTIEFEKDADDADNVHIYITFIADNDEECEFEKETKFLY